MSPLRKRRTVAALAAGALVAAGLVATAPPASAQLVAGQYYQLVAVHSGKAVDIAGASTEPGAMVQQWAPSGGQNQQFRFEPSGGGLYRIIARHSGHVLDVYEWNPDPGAEIRQWTDLNGTNQQWSVIDHGGDVYSFINNFSGLALDVWEWSTADGARLSQWDYTGGDNQRFQLVPVDGGGPGPGPGECGAGTGDAEVTQNGGTYTATNGGSTVYNGGNYLSAINAALNSLNRPSEQRVVVRASGSIGASTIGLASNTTLEVCGTVNVGNRGGRGAVEALNASNVSIPYLTMTGNPYFGMRFYGMNGLHLGQIRLELSGGLGIRFERDFPGSTNVTMDDIFVSGTGNHGVETWNIDGLTIGTVTARDTAYAGLLLNNTRNATIGLVDGVNTAAGTGYATFRTANRNGRIGDSYPTNIRVGEVRSSGGGRGVFCVSESGGLVIDRITLSGNGNNSILIENCYNVTIAAVSGTINGGGELRIAARTEFANTRDVWIQNLTVNNTSVRESPCGDNVNFINISGNAPLNIC